MFLIERLVGISIYSILLVAVCLLLETNKMRCKTILNVYLVCLCIMAFFYKPYSTGDLYRIFETMDYFSTIPFKSFWSGYVLTSSTPVARLLYWVVGKTGVNSLLPLLSALVCYSLIFYVINKTKEIYSVSNANVACVVFFIMASSIYISVIGGIRMMIALSMIFFSFFRWTAEKKFGILESLFLIIAILTHAMGIVVVAMCVLTVLLLSGKKTLRNIVSILFLGIICACFVVFNIDSIKEKIMDYLFESRYSDSWEYLIGVLIIIALSLILIGYRRISKDQDSAKLKCCAFATLLCIIISVCFCFEFSIFYRFCGQLAVLFALPVFMVVLEKSQYSNFFSGISLRSILYLCGFAIAAISFSRGSLSSLKFFEL